MRLVSLSAYIKVVLDATPGSAIGCFRSSLRLHYLRRTVLKAPNSTNWATFRWSVVGDLMISLSTVGVLPDEPWNEFIKEMKVKPIKRYIGTTVGPTEASSLQRKAAADVFKEKAIPAVVITDEALVRGLVTAVSWFGPDIKAFAWADLPKAMKHLRVGPEQERRAIDEITRMKSLAISASSTQRS